MCGRFTLTLPQVRLVAETAAASIDPELEDVYRPRYNIAPTQQTFIVTERKNERKLELAHWGWALAKGMLINLRLETLNEKEYYQKQLDRNRCLIPADGFFEWNAQSGKKEPHWIHSPQRDLLFFGGVYWWKEGLVYFTILTKPAEPAVAKLHDRMPVFVSPASFELWWSAPELFLQAIPRTPLQSFRVNPLVNNTAHDQPENIVPYHEEPPARPKEEQLGLF